MEEQELALKLKTEKAKETYERLFLGNLLKHMRKKAGLTQKELAKHLKTSQSVIARMEAGKQNFTISTLVKIAFIFNKKLHIDFK